MKKLILKKEVIAEIGDSEMGSLKGGTDPNLTLFFDSQRRNCFKQPESRGCIGTGGGTCVPNACLSQGCPSQACGWPSLGC